MTRTQALSQSMFPETVRMKYFIYKCLLVIFVVSSINCQADSTDDGSETGPLTDKARNDNPTSGSEIKASSKAVLMSPCSPIPLNPEYYKKPKEREESNNQNNQRYNGNNYPDQPVDDGRVTGLGFTQPIKPTNNFFLVDDTGRYNVQLQNIQPQTLQQQNPLNTAIGAISAHILNQRPNQEYIPYPPNGDPYNYPPYRGYSHSTEPPAVRAYETANNYGNQPTGNFEQVTPRRVFPNNGYQQPFPTQFDNFGLNFYSNPNIFNGENSYQGFRRNDESYEQEAFVEEFRDNVGRPIKRFA